jgi:hypothetical protein
LRNTIKQNLRAELKKPPGFESGGVGMAGDGFRIGAPARRVADQSVLEPKFVNSASVSEGGEHLSEFLVDAAKITRVAPVARLGGLSGLVFGKSGGDSFQQILRDRGSLAVVGCGGLCGVLHRSVSLHDD